MIKFLIPAFLIAASSLTAATTSPSEIVASANADIKAAAIKPGATSSSIGAVFEKNFDYKELGKRVLDKNWSSMKTSQQEQFLALFAMVLRLDFQPKAVDRAQMQTIFGKESIPGSSAIVPTTVITKTGQISVNYKLYRTPDTKEWRIWDVIIDDVSLWQTYKDQYKTIITKEGFDGLFARLKKKTEQAKNRGK